MPGAENLQNGKGQHNEAGFTMGRCTPGQNGGRICDKLAKKDVARPHCGAQRVMPIDFIATGTIGVEESR
jgi:hypothetical protein